jgi:hypothetical protein
MSLFFFGWELDFLIMTQGAKKKLKKKKINGISLMIIKHCTLLKYRIPCSILPSKILTYDLYFFSQTEFKRKLSRNLKNKKKNY